MTILKFIAVYLAAFVLLQLLNLGLWLLLDWLDVNPTTSGAYAAGLLMSGVFIVPVVALAVTVGVVVCLKGD